MGTDEGEKSRVKERHSGGRNMNTIKRKMKINERNYVNRKYEREIVKSLQKGA